MKRIIIFAALAVVTGSLYAASTGTTALHTITGSGAATTNGDYVSAAGGLNTTYRYFIEVPPGLNRFVVDLFDADIGEGGAAEATANRDRDRTGFNTTATYSLIAPNGTAVPVLFTTGTATLPVGADNAWLSLYDTSANATVRDNFNTVAYTNNDGTQNWLTNWTESNEAGGGNGAAAGLMQIVVAAGNGRLRISDNGNAQNSAIARQANLTGWTGATLTFNCETQTVDAGDQIAVQVSANGGTTWTTLETITGTVAAGSSRSYDISAFISANTAVRFVTVGTGYNTTNFFFVDNLQIARAGGIPNGHWELRVDQSSASTGGSDINALGIRAHDGDSTGGGTELPIYADSFLIIGTNPPTTGTNTRSYPLYPYITSGCKCSENDFDYDSDSGNTGSLAFTSRTGAFPQTFSGASLSVNNAWKRNDISGWTDPYNSLDYGIWTLNASISSYTNPGQNGNYTTLWQSNFNAAANPPTANPQTNAFRIYLPTDAGGSPAKPYLEQQVARGVPVAPVGVPTNYTVTVRIANPSAQAITFSSTNLITANVPGAGAVYGGNIQKSQGTIVSQPSVGGIGNITWNPGTLAAGTTAIMSYDVTVTFTSNGQPIVITGTTASGNGTRATFVDSTGNTTQTRATYTFGPLCELTLTQGQLTEVFLSSVDVNVHGNSTLVKWETASEAGTIGFNLYRVDAATGALTLANETLLPAIPGAPQGGKYRFVDKSSTDAQPAYILEEITANGRSLKYGPFSGGTGDGDALPDSDFDSTAKSNPKDSAPSSHAHKAMPAAAMAGVTKTGITRILATDLADALSMPPAAITSAIKTGRVSITDRGQDVAWLAAADNDSILFFGEATTSTFSKERVYRVSLDKGTPMRTIDAAPAPESATTFMTTQPFEIDAFAATALPLDPDGDFWFWDVIISGSSPSGTKSYTLDVPAVASGNGASLQVRLQGAIQAPHRARVSVNGALLGEFTWSNLDATSTTLPIPAGALHDGSNVVTLQGLLVPGTSFDGFYVDGFAVNYMRTGRAINGSIEMNATPGTVATATAIGSDALVLNVTDRRQTAFIRGGGTSFVVPAGISTLFFADSTAISGPSSLRSSAKPSLADRKNAADYIVIANNTLHDGANALAALRAADRLQTMVVDLDDIYDEFAGGNVTPHAIHDFLAATRSWSKAPRYAVLAGIGTFDYRGFTTSPGLLPPLMAKTSNGLFASDALFADFNGDGVPDIALGRIPVSTNAELLAYVAKLDASAHASKGSTVFSADAVDQGANFKHESGTVETQFGDRPATRLYVDDLGAPATRSRLLAEWQNGPSFINWIGHGGVDRLSKSSLLTVTDTPALTTTTGGLPVLVAMTCTINRFEIGSVQALGTSLTVSPTTGALAVWSASGLSQFADATTLEQTLMHLAANNDHARLGDLIVQALNTNRSIGETANVYLLLGDPALPFSLPAVNPAAGQPSGGIE